MFVVRFAAALIILVAASASAFAQTIETPARYGIMVDFDSGEVLWEKDASVAMPPASMSKLMTVAIVFEKLKAGELTLDTTFKVSEAAWRKQGSKMFLELGSEVRVGDLLRGIIVQSGNDACITIAEGIAGTEDRFAQLMTQRGREIGLKESVFLNATGWPDEGHVMSARDLATLARYMIREFPELYHIYAEREFTWHGIRQANRNPLLGSLPGADGMKTGHTSVSGYGLVGTAVRDGQRLILVVNGLASEEERAAETRRLLDIGFREFRRFELLPQDALIGEAEVFLGAEPTVPLRIGAPIALTMQREARRDLKVTYTVQSPVQAPVQAGTELGTLRIEVPGRDPLEAPVFAAKDIGGAGAFARIQAALGRVLGLEAPAAGGAAQAQPAP